MYDFQLYKPSGDNFPAELDIGGVAYQINTDFKVILRIMAMQERDDVSQLAKSIKVMQLFYGENIPPEFALEAFGQFVSRQKPPENPLYEEPPVMDFLVDGDVIYTSVLMQYGIDLMAADMHWYKFVMLVNGLNEYTPLQERIRIRTADLKHLKGEDLRKARRAKERVALPVRQTAAQAESTQQRLLGQFGM